MPEATQHAAGELAFYQSIASGPVPCKVLRVLTDGWLHVQATATRGGFQRGEVWPASPRNVVPRNHLRRRSGIYHAVGRWQWIPSSALESRRKVGAK